MNIEERNKQFLNELEKNQDLKSKRDELAKGQHPETLVITCSDSRVIPEMIFNCSLGELFVIRTAGNVINEGELASIEYAIEHLKVKQIIVLGHTKCGAIHSAMTNEKGKYMDPILNRIRHNLSKLDDTCSETFATIVNAAYETTVIREKFPDFKGEISYYVYDVKTSELIS